MFSVFKTAWLCLSARVLAVSATGSVGSRLGEVLFLPAVVGVPGLLCHGYFSGCELWKSSLPRAHSLLCVGHWECWPHPAMRRSLQMPPLSVIARFWESKTCFSQSHKPHCWKVGIMPLIAPKGKREGRWLQNIVVDFVLKSISLFHGDRSRDSIVEWRN